MARVDVTVVVPCRDRPELLDRCLTGLRPQLAIFDELIVVDSASASAEVASVAAHHGAVLVRCDEPGASRARNAGWRAARHPVVAFVDDDVVVDPGWVDAIVAPLEQPDTGFVVGPYRLPEGVHLDGPSATLTTIEPPAVMTTAMVGVFGAGNLAMHRRVLERVGGFDERLGPGCWNCSTG